MLRTSTAELARRADATVHSNLSEQGGDLEMVTTTHDPEGGGRPRLIFAFGGTAEIGSTQREFDLLPTVTTIGSGDGADLRLDGLAERHAEVRRDDGDEYVLVDLGTDAGVLVDGQPVEQVPLHTGDRIELGGWTLSYYREEFADHGRPFGGREGGEGTPRHPGDEHPAGDAPQ